MNTELAQLMNKVDLTEEPYASKIQKTILDSFFGLEDFKKKYNKFKRYMKKEHYVITPYLVARRMFNCGVFDRAYMVEDIAEWFDTTVEKVREVYSDIPSDRRYEMIELAYRHMLLSGIEALLARKA